MARPALVTTGLVICGVLGVADIAALGAPFDPPPVITLIGALLGVVTLVAVVAAWRGSRTGLFFVVGSRLASAIRAVPMFFGAATTGPKVIVATVMVVTLAGVALVVIALFPATDRGHVHT